MPCLCRLPSLPVILFILLFSPSSTATASSLQPPAASAAPPLVQLDAFADHSVRVRIAPPGAPMADPPLRALLPQPPLQSHPAPPAVQGRGALTLTNGNLRIDVSAAGLVTATRVQDGAVLLRQTSLVFAAPYASAPASLFSAVVAFAGTPGERVYGLGEHRTGRVEQMGFSHDFRTSQLYPASHGADVMIPYYGSSLGYGFLWGAAGYGNVSLGPDALVWSVYAAPVIDFWITTTPPSPDPSRSPLAYMLQHYADAVGHAAPMPWYTSGFWQCKNRYRTQEQLLAVARGYVTRGLPISIIVIDYYHWVHFGDWSFNPVCWPDVPAMVAELNSLGIELAVTFWPLAEPAGHYFAAFNASGHFLKDYRTNLSAPLEEGDLYCVDETSPAARAAIFDAFWTGYGQYGVRTLWLDATEPERDRFNFGQFRLQAGGDMEVGEAWVREHARAIQEGMARKGLGPSDFLTLARSAWSGSPALSSAVWSGDIASTFAELALQIRSGQAFALSGQILWTTDIGGYGGGDPSDPVFQELIVRWFQFGAFCPLFRLHGQRKGGPPADQCGDTGGDNEVWNLAPDPAHYDAIVSVMKLRENLRDYVMRINAEAAATGMPMMRAMALAFPTDPQCQAAEVEDQFMFGPDWLVAPVYEHQASSRSVYLPPLDAQHQWVYWWNQSLVSAGGVRLTMPTPIGEFPLFWRQPVAALPLGNMTSLFSAQRLEQVLCGTGTCLADQQPQGNYSVQRVEALALLESSGSVAWRGGLYETLPLNLFYSYTHTDNFAATNTTPPDATYQSVLVDGYVLAQQAPGTVPLSLWYKKLAGDAQDYATLASAEGVAWAQANGYRFVGVTGYVWPL